MRISDWSSDVCSSDLGKILEKDANTVLVDVGGVGYEVTIPLSTFYDLGEIGEDVSLRIFTHVREDALQLFGFKTVRERDLYLKQIGRASCRERVWQYV